MGRANGARRARPSTATVRNRRTYTPVEKAFAVLAYHLHADKSTAARQIGVPRKTLSDWTNGLKLPEESIELIESGKEELAKRLEQHLHKIIANIGVANEHIDWSKANSNDLRNAATVAGIFIDKMNVLRGDPSQIIGGTGAREAMKEQLRKMNKSAATAAAPATAKAEEPEFADADVA